MGDFQGPFKMTQAQFDNWDRIFEPLFDEETRREVEQRKAEAERAEMLRQEEVRRRLLAEQQAAQAREAERVMQGTGTGSAKKAEEMRCGCCVIL